jgi:hypothetical protein
LDYYDSLSVVGKRVKSQEQKAKRHNRYTKAKLKALLVGGGCPSAFASYLSDCIDDHSSQTTPYVGTAYVAEFSAASNFCGLPRTFLGKDTTPWHAALEASYAAIDPSAQSKVGKIIDVLRNSEAGQAVAVLSDVGNHLASFSEGVVAFELSGEGPPLLKVQAAWSFSTSIECIALPGVPCFLTAVRGYVWVTLISVADLVKDENTFELLPQVLESESAAAMLKKVPTFGLPPGASVFVPFGYIPITVTEFIGDSDEDKNMSWSAYYTNYVFDPALTVGADSHVLAEVKGVLTKVLARKTKSVQHYKVALEKWVAEWPTVDETAS